MTERDLGSDVRYDDGRDHPQLKREEYNGNTVQLTRNKDGGQR